MKQVYVCEKCGKMFQGDNAWDECYRCEASHCDVETLRLDHLDSERGAGIMSCAIQYQEGMALPLMVTMRYAILDSNGTLITRDDGSLVHGAAVYKLHEVLSSSHVVIESMQLRDIADCEEEKRWLAEYEARQAAKEQNHEEEE